MTERSSVHDVIVGAGIVGADHRIRRRRHRVRVAENALATTNAPLESLALTRAVSPRALTNEAPRFPTFL